MTLDDAFARGGVSAEPGRIPGRAALDTLKVRVGIVCVVLDARNGGI